MRTDCQIAPNPNRPFPLQFLTIPGSLGPSTSSQQLQQQAMTSSNGSSASSTEMDMTRSPPTPQLRQLPGHFEDVAKDDLVGLIGQDYVCGILYARRPANLVVSLLSSLGATADLLDRIIALNDQLPLNEYV